MRKGETTMLYHIMSADAVPGQEEAAMEWMRRQAAYTTRKYPSANSILLRNVTGALQRLTLVETWESLAAWEAAAKDIAAQPDFQALVAEVPALFIAGSVQRVFSEVFS
jgi:quinol monooxygenase YgiN